MIHSNHTRLLTWLTLFITCYVLCLSIASDAYAQSPTPVLPTPTVTPIPAATSTPTNEQVISTILQNEQNITQATQTLINLAFGFIAVVGVIYAAAAAFVARSARQAEQQAEPWIVTDSTRAQLG